MDSTHKTHLQPLFPQDLDADDHRLLDELAGALAEQPPGILSEQWTIDGRRFAGCYVKAQCIHGKWHFTAYPRPYSY